MKIETLNTERLADFVDYCKKYRFDHDESFLYDDDLESFKADENNPTYLLVDDENAIVGTASLTIMPYINHSKCGRFRIFHAEKPSAKAYDLMFEAIKQHIIDLDHLYLFIPEAKVEVGAIIQALDFEIYRYSWVLVRDNIEVPAFDFPDGFKLKSLQFNKDEADWCKVRNTAFAALKGSETPTQPEAITAFKDESEYVDGGLIMLYKEDEPIGIIRMTKEHENDKDYAFIGPLAVMPEYQGMGLGKNLLRAALSFGKTVNLPYGMLCVNAENDKAADLYLKEGFTKDTVMVCYKYQIK